MKEYVVQETEEMTTFGSVWKRYEPVRELVRCQNCKHYDERFRGYCIMLDTSNIRADWYCADGEAKE